MLQYKIIARILLLLPIINFAFALPIAEQETHQVGRGVTPDVPTITSAEPRAEGDLYSGSGSDRPTKKPKTQEKLWNMYSGSYDERPSKKPKLDPPFTPEAGPYGPGL